jgi:sterol desaturase/sphingolipid hydroxylase (fatty acid hydroxylase superfamily)
MENDMSDKLHYIVFMGSVLGIMVLVARQFEKRWPIDPNLRRSDVVNDWQVTALNVALGLSLGPLAGVCSALIINAAGGGFIPLRTDGWWYAVSLPGYIVVFDFYRYGTHRLQHMIPCLWAMHSFHHSAEAITIVTGARHHWLERVLIGAFWPIPSILFRVPPEILMITGFIYFLPDGCAHLNVRFRLGPAITWFNSPQWHRIHHSTRPEHFDKNFASLLPLWDIVFGTAWIPHPDEYPATGLVPGESVGPLASIVWPFRRQLRRLKDHAPDWSRPENWHGIRRIYTKLSGTHDA